MPVTTDINHDEDLTRHVATSYVKDEEMFAAQKEFYENGPTRLQLWDMSDCYVTSITIGGMRTFIEKAANYGKARESGRTAVIVSSHLQFGLARMAEAFGEFAQIPFEFQIFKTSDEAYAWLNEK